MKKGLFTLEDLAEQLANGLGEPDIEALTPTQPKFVEEGFDAVKDQKDATQDALKLLSDEQN